MEIKEIPFLKGYFCSSNGEVFLGQKKMSTRSGGYKNRYTRVQIKRKDYFVHRLVLQTFVGPNPVGFQACHNNGNSKDNRLSNLRWDSPKNNSQDKIKHGTSGKGQNNSMSKISNSSATSIITCYQILSSNYLKEYFGISAATVTGIATGKIRQNNEFKNLYRINKLVAKKRIMQSLKDSNENRKQSSKNRVY